MQYAEPNQILITGSNAGAVQISNSAFWGPSYQIARVRIKSFFLSETNNNDLLYQYNTPSLYSQAECFFSMDPGRSRWHKCPLVLTHRNVLLSATFLVFRFLEVEPPDSPTVLSVSGMEQNWSVQLISCEERKCSKLETHKANTDTETNSAGGNNELSWYPFLPRVKSSTTSAYWALCLGQLSPTF